MNGYKVGYIHEFVSKEEIWPTNKFIGFVDITGQQVLELHTWKDKPFAVDLLRKIL